MSNKNKPLFYFVIVIGVLMGIALLIVLVKNKRVYMLSPYHIKRQKYIMNNADSSSDSDSDSSDTDGDNYLDPYGQIGEYPVVENFSVGDTPSKTKYNGEKVLGFINHEIDLVGIPPNEHNPIFAESFGVGPGLLGNMRNPSEAIFVKHDPMLGGGPTQH